MLELRIEAGCKDQMIEKLREKLKSSEQAVEEREIYVNMLKKHKTKT